MGIFGAVVVGVTTGCVVGYFLVRTAFKRYAAADLVRRQIEWNEQALRAVMEARTLTQRMVPALKNDNQGLWHSLRLDLRSAEVRLQNVMNDSVVYGERNLYQQLRDSVSRCRSLTERLVETVHTAGPTKAADSCVPLLRELDWVLLNLANPLRKKLALEPLEPEDLAGDPSGRNSAVKRQVS